MNFLTLTLAISGCYQIPKSSVLAKIACAKDAEISLEAKTRKAEAAKRAVAESLLELKGQSRVEQIEDGPAITPIEEMPWEMIKKLDSKSLRAHLTSYGQSEIPSGKKAKQEMLRGLVENYAKQLERLSLLDSVAQEQNPDIFAAQILEQFADVAFQHFKLRMEEPLCETSKDDMTSGCDFAIKVKEFASQEELPPFKPSWTRIAYDLSGSDHFPRELYRLVQDAEAMVITHIISWQVKGKSFIVHDEKSFEKRFLTECTGESSSTYDSFVGNLKSFGFVKIDDGSRKGGYRHEFFRRRRPEDLALISRCEGNSSDDEESIVVVDPSPKMDSNTAEVSRRKKAPSRSPKEKCDAQRPETNADKSGRKTGFLEELHRLLEEAKDEGIVDFFRWLPGGASFGISNDDMFVDKVLKKHSKTNKISSFEATLFNLGFKKSRKVGGDRRYQHPSFLQGHPEKLADIRSRTRKKLAAKMVSWSRKRKAPERQANDKTNRRQPASKTRQLEVPVSGAPKPFTPSVSPHQRMNDFAESLRRMLDKNDDATIVSWVSDGSAFSVTKPDQFEESIMPMYFQQMPYPSFRRELKALGFEPAGTSGELKGIMFHGLFQRDYPELWKLYDNDDLNEKVLYCLSHDKQLLMQEMGDDIESKSKDAMELLRWQAFPALQDFLYDSIKSHFPVLVTNRTKSQSEVILRMAKDMLQIAKTQGYTLDESLDVAKIAGSLRKYFRLHFQKVRKCLQFMKTVTENGDAKVTLQSLVRKADSVDLNKLSISEISHNRDETGDQDCSRTERADSDSIRDESNTPTEGSNDETGKADNPIESIDRPLTAGAPTHDGVGDSNHLNKDDWSGKSKQQQSTASVVETANRNEAVENDKAKPKCNNSPQVEDSKGRMTEETHNEQTRPPQPASKKRTATVPSGEEMQAQVPKPKKLKKDSSSRDGQIGATAGSPSTATPGIRTLMTARINNQMRNQDTAFHPDIQQRLTTTPTDSLGQLTDGIVHQAIRALDASLQHGGNSSVVDILRRSHNVQDANPTIISPGTQQLEFIQQFPINALDAFVDMNVNPRLDSISADEIKFMHEILFPGMDFFQGTAFAEPYRRHRVYIKYLHYADGNLWIKKLVERPKLSRADYLRHHLLLCMMNEAFQYLLEAYESKEDARCWTTFLQQSKSGSSLQCNNHESTHPRDQSDMYGSAFLRQNQVNDQQSPQLLRQALQQQQVNELRNLSRVDQLQLFSLANTNGDSADLQSTVAVPTPSPPVDATLNMNGSTGHTNHLLDMLAVMNQNAVGMNSAFDNSSM
jgi:hypothetical protein